VIAGGQLRDVRDPSFLALGSGDLLGVPFGVLLAAVLAVLVGLVVARTTFGRHLVAVGGNRAAARLAGLPVDRVLVGVYAISGVLAAIAGVVATARLGAGDPANTGLLMELSAITAVVVGGTPLSGGRVRILGTVAGVVLMQLVQATLIKNNLPNSTAQMVQAAIIVVAVWAARDRGSR
jgi:ribose transport system permease protein